MDVPIWWVWQVCLLELLLANCSVFKVLLFYFLSSHHFESRWRNIFRSFILHNCFVSLIKLVQSFAGTFADRQRYFLVLIGAPPTKKAQIYQTLDYEHFHDRNSILSWFREGNTKSDLYAINIYFSFGWLMSITSVCLLNCQMLHTSYILHIRTDTGNAFWFK